MGVSTRNIGRLSNQNRVTGTLTCNNSGETIAVTGTGSRIITFQAFNSDGGESPRIELNVGAFDGDTVNGSVQMSHSGSADDVWFYECTYV